MSTAFRFICQEHFAVSKSGKLSSKNAASYANGCFARSVGTAEAVKAATSIFGELLQFTVEGVTCFQDRIAPTLIEAANALLLGGHCDFLHRDYTLCIALVLSFFYRASGVVAEHEARCIKEPSTPKQLAKVFEQALFDLLTDPEGPFKQKPGVYPEESTARTSAQVFISLVVFETFGPACNPVDTSGNVCKQFFVRAICDKDRTPSEETAEDKIVRALLHPEDTGGEAPQRQPNPTLKEKDRNPEQQASSSNSGPDPGAPAAA